MYKIKYGDRPNMNEKSASKLTDFSHTSRQRSLTKPDSRTKSGTDSDHSHIELVLTG